MTSTPYPFPHLPQTSTHRCPKCGAEAPLWLTTRAGLVRYGWISFVYEHIRTCDPATFELIREFQAAGGGPQAPNRERNMGVNQDAPEWSSGTLFDIEGLSRRELQNSTRNRAGLVLRRATQDPIGLSADARPELVAPPDAQIQIREEDDDSFEVD